MPGKFSEHNGAVSDNFRTTVTFCRRWPAAASMD
jgi:hypothetical protein